MESAIWYCFSPRTSRESLLSKTTQLVNNLIGHVSAVEIGRPPRDLIAPILELLESCCDLKFCAVRPPEASNLSSFDTSGDALFDADLSRAVLCTLVHADEDCEIIEAARAAVGAARFCLGPQEEQFRLVQAFVLALKESDFATRRANALEAVKAKDPSNSEDFAEESEDSRMIDALFDCVIAQVSHGVLDAMGLPSSPLGLNVFFGAVRYCGFINEVTFAITRIWHASVDLCPLQKPRSSDGSTLVIAFSSLGSGLVRPEWKKTLGDMDTIVVAHAIDSACSWYCTNPQTGAWDSGSKWEAMLFDLLRSGGFTKVSLIGDSMGGTAALRFSHIANDKVIVFTPQVDLEDYPGVLRSDFDQNRKSQLTDAVLKSCQASCARIVVHVGMDAYDMSQVSMLPEQVEIVYHAVDSHLVSSQLKEEGKLESVVADLLLTDGRVSRQQNEQMLAFQDVESNREARVGSQAESLTSKTFITIEKRRHREEEDVRNSTCSSDVDQQMKEHISEKIGSSYQGRVLKRNESEHDIQGWFLAEGQEKTEIKEDAKRRFDETTIEEEEEADGYSYERAQSCYTLGGNTWCLSTWDADRVSQIVLEHGMCSVEKAVIPYEYVCKLRQAVWERFSEVWMAVQRRRAAGETHIDCKEVVERDGSRWDMRHGMNDAPFSELIQAPPWRDAVHALLGPSHYLLFSGVVLAKGGMGTQHNGSDLTQLRPQCISTSPNSETWITVGAKKHMQKSGRYYHEVLLGEGVCKGEPQVGWLREDFLEGDVDGQGVGDDLCGWAADGVRNTSWHNGPFSAVSWPRHWEDDDIIGCAIDIEAGQMMFSLNGIWVAKAGMCFDAKGLAVFPAISCRGFFSFNLAVKSWRFTPPAGFKAWAQSGCFDRPSYQAQPQGWHRDGDPLWCRSSVGVHLPPHCINVFVPLVDTDDRNGATEFLLGSHRLDSNDQMADLKARVQPAVAAGSTVIFDYRITHRGGANFAEDRAMLYFTYGASWFRDARNHQSKDSLFLDFESTDMTCRQVSAQSVDSLGASKSKRQIEKYAPENLRSLSHCKLVEPLDLSQ